MRGGGGGMFQNFLAFWPTFVFRGVLFEISRASQTVCYIWSARNVEPKRVISCTQGTVCCHTQHFWQLNTSFSSKFQSFLSCISSFIDRQTTRTKGDMFSYQAYRNWTLLTTWKLFSFPEQYQNSKLTKLYSLAYAREHSLLCSLKRITTFRYSN